MLKRIIMLALCAALLACAAQAEPEEYPVMMVDHCEEWVSLRAAPSTQAARLAKVPLFALVLDVQRDPAWGDFVYCSYDGQYGYILSQYLEGWMDPEPDDMPIRVDWAEATDRAFVVDGDGEYVTLMADETLKDVQLLSLSLSGVDEDGNAAFDTETLYRQDVLAAEDWLVVRIAFPGDLPPYGISFTDEAGVQRRYAIGISGRDGDLILSEF